jgi:hypothetical protein
MLDKLIEAPTQKEQDEEDYITELRESDMEDAGRNAYYRLLRRLMNVPGQISPNAMGMDPNIQQAVASPQVFHPAPPDAPKPNAGMYSDMDEQHTTPDEGQPPIRKLLESANIAENLDEDKLREIGSRCKRGFEQDTREP